MNPRIAKWAKENYPDSKADLFSMFMERSIELVPNCGYMAMINLPSWLFLSSFEKLRFSITNNYFIESLLHMGRGIFGVDWGSTAFVIKKNKEPTGIGNFYRLHKKNFQHIYYDDIGKLFVNSLQKEGYKYNFELYRDTSGINEIGFESHPDGLQIHYRSSTQRFSKIPGRPIAYWISDTVVYHYENKNYIKTLAKVGVGLQTGDNNKFIRAWYELYLNKIGFDYGTSYEAKNSGIRWFPCNKGGDYRKWYGNQIDVIDWKNNGFAIKSNVPSAVIRNEDSYFSPVAAWSKVSSSDLAFRYFGSGFVHNDASCFVRSNDHEILYSVISVINSNCVIPLFSSLNPTLNFVPGQMEGFPLPKDFMIRKGDYSKNGVELIRVSKLDWDSSEISWGFKEFPLVKFANESLEIAYINLRDSRKATINHVKKLEEDNNRTFIDAYMLHGEVQAEVPLSEITLIL